MQPTKAAAAKVLALNQFLDNTINHMYNDYGKKQTLDELLATNPDRWNRALSNEWGRLSSGNIYGVECTNTIEFINKNDVPETKKVTYTIGMTVLFLIKIQKKIQQYILLYIPHKYKSNREKVILVQHSRLTRRK